MAIVYFDYAEGNKIYTSCPAKLSFILLGGKWLLDNVFFVKGIDLKSLLLRKDYDALSKKWTAINNRKLVETETAEIFPTVTKVLMLFDPAYDLFYFCPTKKSFQKTIRLSAVKVINSAFA